MALAQLGQYLNRLNDTKTHILEVFFEAEVANLLLAVLAKLQEVDALETGFALHFRSLEGSSLHLVIESVSEDLDFRRQRVVRLHVTGGKLDVASHTAS